MYFIFFVLINHRRNKSTIEKGHYQCIDMVDTVYCHHLEGINCIGQKPPSARGSNVEGGFAVSIPKPLSKLVRKPRRIQTGFRETKRTIVVARYPGVEVNNATHHVDETGAAPHRCKSHPPRAILPDLFVPFRCSDVYPIFRTIGDSIFPFCDRSCLSIFHYAVLGKYNIYSQGVR